MATFRGLALLASIALVPCWGQLRLIEIDPAHSHLSQLHARMLPGVSDTVHIYSPLSAELAAHLAAIARNNGRAADPTHWSVQLFAGPEYLAQLAREPPGGIVVFSGRNAMNIGSVEAALRGGQHVYADKPWIIDAEAFPRLEAALKLARSKHLVAMDWMPLRSDPRYRLVREVLKREAVFGEPVPGTADQPSVRLENLHAMLKYSGGVGQRRPAAFLDVRQQGEAIADVGTHLADIAQWTLFPGQEISYRRDIRVLRADHSAVALTLDQLRRLTGESDWPAFLKDKVTEGKLADYTNGSCLYTIKGVHVSLKSAWQFEAAPGEQDSYFISYLGSRAMVELRAGAKEHFVPQIYLTPAATEQAVIWEASVKSMAHELRLSIEKQGRAFHLILPESRDDGLEMFQELLGFIRDWSTFPESENSNLLAKYYVTTTAVALANGR
jgi:predicted dehydrogenase